MKIFENLISHQNKIHIPAYQRAYAWEEKQIEQFVIDLIEIKDRPYYYGHFILEEIDDKFEVIDGQQRITTYVLFLISAKLYKDFKLSPQDEDFILNKFETIDYDSERFRELVQLILSQNVLLETTFNETSSIKRIIAAIKSFKKIFINKGNDIDIEFLKTKLLNAKISAHTTNDKAVAVQIFELQNSRGININLLEKVKAKLMKALYLSGNKDLANKNVEIVQDIFAKIYHLEEETKDNSFRGDLTLDTILFYHLRVVDDGFKLGNDVKQNDLKSPGINNEEPILKYLTQKLNIGNPVDYVLNFSGLFLKSVQFTCEKFLVLDEQNSLFGDCLILNRNRSIEMFLILLHLDVFEDFDLKNWELFLFTYDFHEKLKGTKKSYRNRFERTYQRIIKGQSKNEEGNLIESLNSVMDDFIKNGFRGDKVSYDLQRIYHNYVDEKKQLILEYAFHFRKEKMKYLLYKYELSFQDGQARVALRKIFKEPNSIEHILPQDIDKIWYDKIKNKEDFIKKTKLIINGIGNLLLLSSSENSSKGNNHPSEKTYKINSESYNNHNDNRSQWNDPSKWEQIILNRGEHIYAFMKEYFTLNYNKEVK